jgi:dolichyl-phosphate beta-glucosyltransferase
MNKTPRQDKDSEFLSVIIPCYNEEKLIEDTLDTVTAYLAKSGYSHEIIVVDDGSRDNTAGIVSRFAKRCPRVKLLENGRNRGKGFSVRTGVLKASGELVCFSDADLSTPIEEVEKLLYWIRQGFDIAIGSRSLEDSEVELHQPWWREMMGRTFNLFVRIMAVRGIKDTQCGFKCFRGPVAGELFSRQVLDGFSFDVESLFIARKLGYSVKEVPVRWINRAESKVNPVTSSLEMLRDLFRIRLRNLFGGYVNR